MEADFLIFVSKRGQRCTGVTLQIMGTHLVGAACFDHGRSCPMAWCSSRVAWPLAKRAPSKAP